MGQIVIDIPDKTNHRYSITNRTESRALIAVLENKSVTAIKKPARLSKKQIENARIFRASMKNLTEMVESGEFHTVDQLREEFGLG